MENKDQQGQNAKTDRTKGASARPKSESVMHDNSDSGRQSLNALVKESNNDRAVKLKDEIDNFRKERSKLIARVKDCRRRLSYKEAESAAIDKLLKMKKEEDKDGSKRKKIGYLKRMKSRLEFKISTEASSLSQEKEMIRHINDINQELDEALASVRLERKIGFITSDIEEYRKSIIDINAKIAELDTKLDGLYVSLRRALGIGSWQNKIQKQRKQQPVTAPEINLEDIAVIKKKDAK